MLSWFLGRKLDQFEQAFDYDMSYAREILRMSPKALITYFKATAMGNYREDVPSEAFYAARLVAIASEDCGPCTQLGATLARRAGVDAEIIERVIAGDFDALPAHVAVTARFALASMQRSPDADELRERVEALFGRRGLLSIAFGMTASRIYPTIKFALGYGKTCQRVVVDGKTIAKGAIYSDERAPAPLVAEQAS